MTSSVSIVGVCGSMAKDSSTRKTLTLALQAAQNCGATTELLDLRELRLPFAESQFDPDDWRDVARLNHTIKSADGLIWASPEYHGSFTGSLKNALDLGTIDTYSGKVIGLIGVAAGQIGAIQTLGHLRTVARQLHAWCLPQQLSIARAYAAFDDIGALNDPKLAESLELMSRELVFWSRVHRDARALS